MIFDLDDTLVGTADASFAAWVEVAGRLRLAPPTRESFADGYRELPFRDCFDRWFGSAIDFHEFCGLYWDAVHYGPIGDVPALVRELRDRGVRTGIVTNSTRAEAAGKLVSAGIPGELFDFLAGRPEASGRPPPKDLRKITADQRTDPAAAVHVSDNPADFAPSVRAGLPFRGVLTGVFTAADFDAAGVARTDVHPDVHAAIRTALAP